MAKWEIPELAMEDKKHFTAIKCWENHGTTWWISGILTTSDQLVALIFGLEKIRKSQLVDNVQTQETVEGALIYVLKLDIIN